MVDESSQNLTEEQLNEMSEDQILDLYVDRLMEDKGLTEMSEDIKKEIHDDLKEKLIFQVNRAVVAELPDDRLDELNDLLDKNEMTEEKMLALVQEAGVDADKVVAQTLADFREVYLNGAPEEAEDTPEELDEDDSMPEIGAILDGPEE